MKRMPRRRLPVVCIAAGVLVGGAVLVCDVTTMANADDGAAAKGAGAISDDGRVKVADFSALQPGAHLPHDWEPLQIGAVPRHTEYTLASVDGVTVVRAQADSSMSALGREVDIDPHATPWLRWRWSIAGSNEKSALRNKQGDDFPARLYVFFDFDIMRLPLLERVMIRVARTLYGERLPLATLCYVWATDEPPGTAAWSAYTERVRMVVASSGDAQAGQWILVERNVREDFIAAFGEPVPRITGIAIATDSDNTGARSEAWYGDISFSRQRVMKQ